MRSGDLFAKQPETSPLLEKDKKFQKGDNKMTQISRARRPVQSTKKGSEPNQDTNTIRPSRNVSKSNVTSINLSPRTMQKARRTRKRSKINITLTCSFRTLRPATLIPNKWIKSRATFTIMINRDPGNGNHETMQIRHDRIPIATSLKQFTPCINQDLGLMSTTKISSKISLNITSLIN